MKKAFKNTSKCNSSNSSISKFVKYKFSDNSDYITKKYIIKDRINFLLNICNQNENIVVERFGKFYSLQKPGFFFAIPIIDKLKYVVDIRELTIPIMPQHSITQDNVSLNISGVLYIKIDDPYKTSYGVSEPIFAVSQFAQAAMRAVVGRHTLDDIFHNRSQLNEYIISSLKDGLETWGIKILRYEITDIEVNKDIKEAMSRQANAERKRREDVLHAEALKKSQILESEGYKQKLINESEGKKIQVENEALASANSIKITADAEKYNVVTKATAKAEALRIISEQLNTENGVKSAQLDLATNYLKEFGKIVGQSNSIIIPGDVNDINNILVKAMSISGLISKEVKENKKI